MYPKAFFFSLLQPGRHASLMSCGGATEVQAPTPEVQALCDSVKQGILHKVRSVGTPEFRLVGFRSQVVAGTNYFVNIAVGDGGHLHARIFQPLPHTGTGPEVVAVKLATANDELVYFEA